MAEKKEKKTYGQIFDKQIEKSGGTKIGEFQESTGGGTPMAKGEKIDYVADNPQEAERYKKDNPGAIVRVSQPRDENGQFTYNSVNKRGLKYGPSRGKTIPPFLLNIVVSFAYKSGAGSFIGPDERRYRPPQTFTDPSDLIEAFKEYSEADDSFVGKTGLSFDLNQQATAMGGQIGKNITTVRESVQRDFSAAARRHKRGGNIDGVAPGYMVRNMAA